MSTLVILDSDSGELDAIDRRLQKDGFKTTLSSEHKLRYMWRQLLRSETSLSSSLESVEELRKQHAQEMIEVETYVDHIRQLSNERETLTVDLEVENEKLKAELEELREEQEKDMLNVKEIGVILKDSGLVGNKIDKLSIKDHLSNLVRDHAKTLGKVKHLETENTNLKTTGSSSDSQAAKLLEQERKEMEEEMIRMQDSMKLVKQEERRIHEEEINSIKMDKQEFQKKFNASEKKSKDFQLEVLNLKRKMEDEQRAHNKDMTELIRNKHDSENQEKGSSLEYSGRLSKVMEEMEQVKHKQIDVEKQKVELQETVSVLENDLKREKEAALSLRNSEDVSLKDVRQELDSSKQKYIELQVKSGKLETEKRHGDAKLHEVQKDLENLQQMTTQKASVQLNAANETIGDQRNKIDQLTLQLAQAEQTINDNEQRLETTEKELKNQINKLKQQLSLTTSEAVDLRNELTRSKDDYDEMVLKMKEEAEQMHGRYNEETDKTKSTSEEVSFLRAQIAELKQDLNASLSASVARETETSEHVETLVKTRDELVAELNRCIGQGKNQKGELETLRSRIQQLEQEKSSLQSIVLSQERKVAEINDKLQITERKLAEQEGVVSYERNRNTDTNQKFEMTAENLNIMKQECVSLREELRVLSEKLLKQHDAALESQSKYDVLITQLRNEMQHEREMYAVERHKLASQLEQAVKESKDFSSLLRQRDEELSNLQNELNMRSRSGVKTSTALEFESRLRETLENKNNTLEAELAKAWGQTKSLMERLATLEADKGQLERELERKSQLYQLTENSLQKKDANVVSLAVARDTAEQRAEAGEIKLTSLQREKDNIQRELERTQRDLGEAYHVKAELEMKKEESHTLKSQLDDEEQNRSIHRQTIDELKHQVDMLHEREHVSYGKTEDLQRTIRDYENRIEALQDKLQRVTDDHKTVEDEGKSVVERFHELQRAKEQLQVDVLVAAERIEYLETKCERRKMKAIHKIQGLKDRYEREKRIADATVMSLQNTLDLSKKKILKEEEWKQTTDSVRKQLVQEKQDLLTRLTENEEVIREHLRNLREAETRLSAMEKDNLEMRDKGNILARQNEHLERLNKILEKTENQSRSPMSSSRNNQALYEALNKIRLNESLNSMDYSPQVSLNAPLRTLSPDKSANSFNGSFLASSSSGTLMVN